MWFIVVIGIKGRDLAEQECFPIGSLETVSMRLANKGCGCENGPLTLNMGNRFWFIRVGTG